MKPVISLLVSVLVVITQSYHIYILIHWHLREHISFKKTILKVKHLEDNTNKHSNHEAV